MAREPGLRGRLPKKPEGERFAIAYLPAYLAEPLPAPVYPVDVTHGITEWQMLANGPDPTCTTHPDGVGDCTFAGRQHNRMAKALASGATETWETSDDLVAEYLDYDHGQDVGAQIADLLLSWYNDKKILGFAPLDHADRAQVDAAVTAFHGVYAGVNLTSDADSLFTQGLPWTTEQGQQPNPQEGHCIIKVASDGSLYDTWVTWGTIQQSSFGWTAACLDEAWVIITQEDADQVDLAALQADIDALHGTRGAASFPVEPASDDAGPAVVGESDAGTTDSGPAEVLGV